MQTARTAALPPFSQTGRQRRPPPAAFAHTGSGPASPVWRKKSGSLVRWRWRVARQRAAAHLCIALGILEQVEQEFDRLRRPAALGGRRARRVLRLRMPADAAVEEAERHRLLLLQYVLEVALRLLERHRAAKLRLGVPHLGVADAVRNPAAETRGPWAPRRIHRARG